MNSLSQIIPAKGISVEKKAIRKWSRQSRERWEEKGTGSDEMEEKRLLQMEAEDRKKYSLADQINKC